MFKKGFSTILIIVIVLVVIAGGVLAWQYWPESVEQESPTDNEIADWKTYSNDEHGFTIKYPLFQGIKPFTPDGSYRTPTIVEFRPQYAWEPKGEGGWEPARLEISYEIYNGQTSLEEYIIGLWDRSGPSITKDLLQTVVISGLDGYTLVHPIDNTSQYNYVLRGGKVYTFYMLADGEFKTTSNQMLSTFIFNKIEDEVILNENVGWTTYRNQEYGFEIEYSKEVDDLSDGYFRFLDNGCPVFIMMHDNPNNIGAEDFFENTLKDTCWNSNDSAISSKTNIKISDYDGVRVYFDRCPPGGYPSERVYLSGEGKAMVAMGIGSEVEDPKLDVQACQEAYNLMLSSFRFLK